MNTDHVNIATQTANDNRKWYFRWWAWCLWIFLTVLVSLAAIALWLWSDRYNIVENWLIGQLAEQGIDAELDVISATSEGAVIRDIRIKSDGRDLIELGEIRLDYIWPDIRDRKIERIEFDNLQLDLRLDENWRPSDPLLAELMPDPEAKDAGPGFVFPTQGIGINTAKVSWIIHWGKRKLRWIVRLHLRRLSPRI